MAARLGVSVERLDKMISRSEIRTVMSLEKGSEEGCRLEERIPGSLRNSQEYLIRKEEIDAVKTSLKTLTEKEQRIVELYYYQGLSLNKISKEFGVSEARISQIHSVIKSKMRYKLTPLMAA
jgi:RNA polymerase sigma factor for flagellar operon FliA